MTVSTYLKKKKVDPPKNPGGFLSGLERLKKANIFYFADARISTQKTKVEIFFKVVFSVRIVKKEKVQP